MLSPLRRELKIRGEIGEAGHTDSVISSVVTSLTLSTALGTTLNLKLDRLTQFLEGHNDQKNAHDLCNAMTTMLQSPEESVYTFMTFCLEACQKILLASEKSCDLSCSPGFINKLFLRTIKRVFQNHL